jgi:restriction system protein
MAKRQALFEDLMEMGSSAVVALLNGARTDPKNIAEMSWREFERLVGEAFRQRGYTVTGFGNRGSDGGVDLALIKNGERFLVQCKHWRTQQVGVIVVRELNGVIAALGAHGGFLVTGGKFTQEAKEFAQNTKIELIDGKAFAELVGSVDVTSSTCESIAPTTTPPPSCPRCGTAMIRRVAEQGKHEGRSFWGCRQYPKCAAILQTT